MTDTADSDRPADSAFPVSVDRPRRELEELLRELIGRAEDVLITQGRLQTLLAATNAVTSDLTLPVVLRTIAQAACGVAHAKYGALGVLSPDGRGLSEFITVGVDADTAARIGPPPAGRGLLGALIVDPRPVRLKDLATDPRSVGFPPNHPPMKSFLGVPVHTRGTVFGNLYLAESASGEFSAEDEELIRALAATAGVAIDNARMFERGQRREQWLEASAEISRQLLSSTGEDPLQLVAHRTRAVAAADLVTVVLPTADARRVIVEFASGEGADDLHGYSYPVAGSVVGEVFETRGPVVLDDVEASGRVLHLSQALAVGPVMAVPLVGNERLRGALVVGRRRGARRFDDSDVTMALTFANHAALALELADARSDQQKMMLLEDRERIGRDLHDHVVQRLFAAGLLIDSVSAGLSDDRAVQRLGDVVTQLDKTISQIRTTIFQLSGPVGTQLGQTRGAVLAVADDVTDALGFQPGVRFRGPVDAVVDEALLDDLVAVVRECLTNVAKHAQATSAEVLVDADPTRLTVAVIDDGIGIGASGRRSGLKNLRARARAHHGDATIGLASPSAEDGRPGTAVRWSVPLGVAGS